MAKAKYRDEFNWKAGAYIGLIDAKTVLSNGAFYKAGFLYTKLCIVGFYVEEKYFSFDLVVNGRHMRRRYDIANATERQIKMYANRYIKEVHSGS